ncbi:MAG: putative metal-dependent hydrolase [Thermoanaerobaculia bacterium]|nr:putative metal-dependent hydrolase [Thermoanaerobaculia bacterium]
MDPLRYPIGKFEHSGAISDLEIERWIDQIEELPGLLRAAVSTLSDAQLDTRYRPDGWTLRQVIHHVPDSHTNAYIRFKWALTEERPLIKAYDEKAWANLADSRLPVAVSLDHLAAIHARWVGLLRCMTREQFDRTYDHPESGDCPLDWVVGMYAWHGRHHLAHVTKTLDREGWRSGE